MINRRTLLARSAFVGGVTLIAPRIAFARAATDKRLLFILQRGAADGLSLLPPIGDPDYQRQRGRLAEEFAGLPVADSIFALHPALENTAALFDKRQALFVQAVATSYRARSHFDGQNLLESGGQEAYALRSGWMNRLLGLLPENSPRALALSPSIPLLMQGEHGVSSYAPSALPENSAGMMDRVIRLYESDPQLSLLLSEALAAREMAGETRMRNLRNARATGSLAASLMKGQDGARIMMIESDGWDSHAGQSGQFRNVAGRLDTMLGAFQAGMGRNWNDTLVLVATEFGRTAKANGTNGTDHGTASATMLLGGAVKGGRVLGEWPGLVERDLYENRDLRPTGSLEAVLAGAVSGHFGIDPERTMEVLFPGRNASPMAGLLNGA